MKFAHISDLHLGIELNGYSLIEDQKYILTKIINILDEQKVDGVLIAGDVYDKGIASLEAIKLFENFLTRLIKKQYKVFIISGNHDTAERLTFGHKFMESSGIFFSNVYDGNIKKVTVSDDFGPVNVYLLPFVKPSAVRFYNPDEKIDDFTDAIRVILEKLQIDKSERNVILVHQNIQNAEHCDSEGAVYGGLDGINADLFLDFDYTALGHLHGPQFIGGENKIRYCGTPLKYSLSEKNHKKSVTIVELKEKGKSDILCCPLVPLRNVREIRGTFEQIVKEAESACEEKDDYVSIILTDEDEILNAFGSLKNIYPHIVQMTYDNKRTQNKQPLAQIQNVKALNPLELFDRFYENRNGLPMSDEQRLYMKELIEDIWEGKK